MKRDAPQKFQNAYLVYVDDGTAGNASFLLVDTSATFPYMNVCVCVCWLPVENVCSLRPLRLP